MKDYDYSQEGYYFITICTHFKAHMLSEVTGNTTKLTAAGAIVQSIWDAIPRHFDDVQIDAFVVMPNHVHGILHLTRSGSSSVPGIVQTFKSISTRRIHNVRSKRDESIWQRNYYERIIRTERELALTRLYIVLNPLLWNRGADLGELDISETKLAELLEKFQPTLP